ncbi:hypothetical protein Ciccas_008078, partial [Cichlidogyrus casuarinus]
TKIEAKMLAWIGLGSVLPVFTIILGFVVIKHVFKRTTNFSVNENSQVNLEIRALRRRIVKVGWVCAVLLGVSIAVSVDSVYMVLLLFSSVRLKDLLHPAYRIGSSVINASWINPLLFTIFIPEFNPLCQRNRDRKTEKNEENRSETCSSVSKANKGFNHSN